MPSVLSLELPLPKNWQDFETIVRDALAQRWKSTTLQKNGRTGQKQHGIDIWGPDEIGRSVGIQCKRYKGALNLNHVSDEVANAENFKGQLTTLFVATTAEHDAKLQQQVRLLSDKRVAQGKFAVSLLYWDEIAASLVLNPAVFSAHYPQIKLEKEKPDRERLIAALELGYYGADLWASIVLHYGEFGWMTQTDPDNLLAIIRILERRVQQLLPPTDADQLVKTLVEVREGCAAPKTNKSDWDQTEVKAKRVSSRIQAATSLLALPESNVLELSLVLGRIYQNVDDRPPPATIKSVHAKVTGVLPTASAGPIKTRFAAASKISAGYDWAQKIFGLLDHELRYRE
ncbi:restriction endonuclease [Rhizobium sullae]|uniref:Restriction endonuclease n=1 Tax=Rhizobium sullae TaxID=50338 RepID=A0A4R3PZI5_RHISU|nr:restriction endonuclease [Rhizobium sullae]TCU13739.1 restriction endonuclease [Rhizobium sullae]